MTDTIIPSSTKWVGPKQRVCQSCHCYASDLTVYCTALPQISTFRWLVLPLFRLFFQAELKTVMIRTGCQAFAHVVAGWEEH